MVCLALLAVRSIRVSAFAGDTGAVLLPKCATSSQWPSGDSEIEPGCGATLMEVCTVLVASDITSMRFAVKLATYRTPRVWSSATSAASPPIATTVPNVPGTDAPVPRTAPAIINHDHCAKTQDLRNITFLKLHFRPLLRGSGSPAKIKNQFPHSHCPLYKSPRDRVAPAMASHLAERASRQSLEPNRYTGVRSALKISVFLRYSTFFLRRSTMIPRKRTASTAQTTRTLEVSIVPSPFLTRVNSAPLTPTFRQY